MMDSNIHISRILPSLILLLLIDERHLLTLFSSDNEYICVLTWPAMMAVGHQLLPGVCKAHIRKVGCEQPT